MGRGTSFIKLPQRRRRNVDLEHYPTLLDQLTGIILSRGKEHFEMRCGVSDEKRDAATGQKNPASGGPERLIGCVAALAR